MSTATIDPGLTAGMRSSQEQARRLVRSGCWIVLGAILPLGLWMAFAPLSMAVVAPAFVKVDLNRRPVQHLEGGTVREVLVRDGQHVNAGDPVLVLGDVRVDADRNRLSYRVYLERAALVRLDAEQALAKTLVFPSELLLAAEQDERIKQALAERERLVQGTALLAGKRSRADAHTA